MLIEKKKPGYFMFSLKQLNHSVQETTLTNFHQLQGNYY